MNNQLPTKKAIIIGAGIAGIAAAIRLKLLGFSVEVFEQNSYPGGKLADFKLGDYHFDAGPSLFTQPQNIKELFELAGEKMSNHFEYHQLTRFLVYQPNWNIIEESSLSGAGWVGTRSTDLSLEYDNRT